ncbi:MAG: hypothetical protein R3E12_13490 [Candidatus Eisenbacteria bacterium]|uniref:Lipoprotein n=1 Tax=Eiseniibacteriota bacterium TaxID=2212470 RepID=A0A956LY52_UNCEI|nr:hypothetical protein [Candidatus Eisenbacteria bacterium]
MIFDLLAPPLLMILLLGGWACSDSHDTTSPPVEPLPEPEPPVTLSGTYDVSGSDGFAGTVTAASGTIDVRVVESSRAVVLARGLLTDGVAPVTGTRSFTDVGQIVNGTATVSRTDDDVQIDLVLNDGQYVYHLSRSRFDPGVYAGTWTFSFSKSLSGCDMEAEARLDLDFGEIGVGSGALASEAADGQALGTIDPTNAFVAPSGRFAVEGTYLRAEFATGCSPYPTDFYASTLLGTLEPKGATIEPARGSGTAEVALHPEFSEVVDWTAEEGTGRVDQLADLVGTYDLTSDRDGIGVVSVSEPTIVVDLALFDTGERISASGDVIDGIAQVSGARHTPHDDVPPSFLTGTATVSTFADRLLVDLLLVDEQGDSTMYPLSRDPNFEMGPYADGWEITFATSPSGCRLQTSARCNFQLPASGIGGAPETTDQIDATPYGRMVVRKLFVSSSGRMLLETEYTTEAAASECGRYSTEAYDLTLFGQIPDRTQSGAIGTGAATIASDLGPVDQTTWVAQAVD